MCSYSFCSDKHQARKQFTNSHPVKMKLSTSLAIAAAASSATAHTIFVSLNGGAVGDGVRVPSYDGVSLPSYFLS